MSKEYYPYPWQIIYAQHQIRWLISPEARNLIKAGQWPFSIKDDSLANRGVSHRAVFVMISDIKVELEERLESVDRDGDLCLGRYYDEYEDERIAQKFYVPFDRVKVRIKRAMRYMAGRGRKKVTYSEWIQNGWSETPRRPKDVCVS